MKKIETVLHKVGIDDQLTVTKIKYGLAVIKDEVIKLIIIGLLYYIFDDFISFLFSVAILFPVRFFAGGMHLRTNIGCFLFSLGFFILSINILPSLLLLNDSIYLIVMIVSSFIIVSLAPTPSKKRPIRTRSRRKCLKISSSVVITIIDITLLVLFFYGYEKYYNVGVWVLMLQALQMLIPFFMYKRKEEEYGKISI